jgi:LysM repeat protein
LTIWVTQEKVATLRNFDLMSFSEKESMRSGDAFDLAQGSRLKGKGVVPAPSQSWTQHEVIEGESLDKIARQYGTTVEDLKNWNQLTGNRIRVGQKLEIYNLPERRVNLIPAPATNKAAPEPLKEQTPGEIVHKVKKGETVFEIARSYSVQPSVLMAYNNLRTSKLRVGQILRIPASTHSGNIINH